jgi:hypothetical protein
MSMDNLVKQHYTPRATCSRHPLAAHTNHPDAEGRYLKRTVYLKGYKNVEHGCVDLSPVSSTGKQGRWLYILVVTPAHLEAHC